MSSTYQKLDTEQFLFSIDTETFEFYVGKWDSNTSAFSFSGWIHGKNNLELSIVLRYAVHMPHCMRF